MHDRPRLHAPPPPGPESSRDRQEDEREKKEVPRGVAVVNFYVNDPPDEDE